MSNGLRISTVQYNVSLETVQWNSGKTPQKARDGGIRLDVFQSTSPSSIESAISVGCFPTGNKREDRRPAGIHCRWMRRSSSVMANRDVTFLPGLPFRWNDKLHRPHIAGRHIVFVKYNDNGGKRIFRHIGRLHRIRFFPIYVTTLNPLVSYRRFHRIDERGMQKSLRSS